MGWSTGFTPELKRGVGERELTMLTNDDLDRIEREASEMEYFPLHDEVADLVKMARRSIELEAELSEQCRLLGAGSEREARLMARVAELEAINSQRKEGGEG